MERFIIVTEVLPTCLPTVMPGVLASTMKADSAFVCGAFGSAALLVRTKNQLATPAFVIHIF
jgi:hypothetical protein